MIDNNISWFEKYRPKTINDMVFENTEIKKIANKWILDGYIDGNVILSGTAGTGKTTLIEILIQQTIKAGNDLFRMKTRSVNELDEKLRPFLNKKAVKSKKKIAYIEELDALSSQGIRELKEKYMEKFQQSCSFLCTTNFIKKIDNALLTRFTYKINFSSSNIVGIKDRLKTILDLEQCQYDEKKLLNFVEKNHKKGLRDLINSLQIESVSTEKNLTFESSETSLNLEGSVSALIFNILKIVLDTKNNAEKRNYKIMPVNTAIGKDYEQLVQILHNNYNINYNNIYDILIEKNNYLPMQIILSKFSETLENKKYPHLHLISCLYELIKCSIEITP